MVESYAQVLAELARGNGPPSTAITR